MKFVVFFLLALDINKIIYTQNIIENLNEKIREET